MSDLIMASGPITYIGVWIIVIFLLICYDWSETAQATMITYAALPIGPIVQSGTGYILYLCGV